MMRCLTIALALFSLGVLSAAWVSAAPLDPELQKQLLAIYHSYNKAIAAGKVDAAMKLRSADTRKMMEKELKNSKQRAGLLEMAKSMIPDKIEPQHSSLSGNGLQASILTIASKAVPEGARPDGPPPGTILHGELTLDFVKERGVWKYDTQTFGMDPSQITACTSEAFEPIEAYDQDSNVSVGGPIRRVVFADDHTLVVIRVVDQETCTFLPDRARLQELGLDTTKLVEYAIVEIEGFQHRSDPQKVWVDSLKVRPE